MVGSVHRLNGVAHRLFGVLDRPPTEQQAACGFRFASEQFTLIRPGCRRAGDARRLTAPIVLTETTALRFKFTDGRETKDVVEARRLPRLVRRWGWAQSAPAFGAGVLVPRMPAATPIHANRSLGESRKSRGL
jgi:hypothetical protein